MYFDYHTHTEFSDDSVYDMEECVKDAIALGIEEMCFTDHVDYGIKKDWVEGNIIYRDGEPMANVDYPAYFQKLAYVQDKYKDQITIKKGLEFGMQMHTIDQYEKLIEKYPLDFVILSVHQVNNKEFWTYDFQKDYDEPGYYRAYYEELYQLVTHYHHYCVLGHMDLLKRYDDHDGYHSFEANKDLITKILQCVIDDGKGIELNTSSVRYGLDCLMPSREILQLYHDLGGTVLTIGSDSHSKQHLENAHIPELMQTLKDIGFQKICTFDKMKPIFHDL